MGAYAELQWQDVLVILAYFASVTIVGVLSSCRNRGSIGGYFLAGRTMNWIPVGASLFASNIGSGHFVGLAGSGAASGLGISVFELNAIYILVILGWLFVPVYIAAGVFTMPEYLRKRFGGQRIRIYLSVLALLLYVFTKISADLYSGAIFLTQALPELNLYVAIIILLAVSAIFTIGGGLTAVIWTDFIQTVIMIGGAFVLMIMSFVEVGGYEQLKKKFFKAFPNTTRQNMNNNSYPYTDCGIPPANSWNLIRSADDGGLPWPGVMVGLTISSIWYWCSDQVIVQRVLAAKNMANAKAGTLFAGYLKFLPMWLIVFPGMIARVLYPDKIACADPDVCESVCGSRAGCTNIAYPTLVLELMPPGLRGLMLAVMMSALISSLTSIFNSTSTIFTMDVWRRIRKAASEVELMIVGRLCVLALVAVGIAWIPVVQNISELFHYIQAITSFLAPPVCAVYVLAVFWKRTNEPGAFWGLMVGLLVGLIRFIWEYSYSTVPCGESDKDKRPAIISKVHYLHFGILLCGIVTIVTVVVSLLTKPIDDIHLQRLTFWTRHSTLKRVDLSEVDDEKNPKPANLEESRKSSFGISEVPYESLPWHKKMCHWICGIEKMTGGEQHLSAADVHTMKEKQTSIAEETWMRRVLDVNALVLIILATIVWGYFA